MSREDQLGTKAEVRRARFFLVVARVVAISLFCRTASAVEPPSSQWSFAEMDKMSAVKGWNITFPSFGDTFLQDYRGWRSSLASGGIGLIEYNITRFQANLLDTPREGPRFNSFYESNQNYFGQKPSFNNFSTLVLTYDLSRFGVPDGQLQYSAFYVHSSWQGFLPEVLATNFLAYYQTFFDRQLEMKFGLLASQGEFIGQTVGSNFVTTGGPANSIPTQLGMSVSPVSTWSFRLTGHFGKFYYETSVIRSLVVNGPSGNPLFDTDALNPTRFDWNVNTSSYSATAEVGAPGTGELFANEFGYKQISTPDSLFTWGRAGVLYNNSTFHDFTKSVADGGLVRGPIGPTREGNVAFYLLADQQLWQSAPGSVSTAGRGLYVGGTAMYARPETTAITQYYEGRVYVKGPFASRPKDLVSVVGYYSVHSPYLVDNLRTLNAAGTYGKAETWSTTIGYLAYLRPGAYLTLGLSYTANPSQANYFGPSIANPSQRFEGNALNFQATLFTAF